MYVSFSGWYCVHVCVSKLEITLQKDLNFMEMEQNNKYQAFIQNLQTKKYQPSKVNAAFANRGDWLTDLSDFPISWETYIFEINL